MCWGGGEREEFAYGSGVGLWLGGGAKRRGTCTGAGPAFPTRHQHCHFADVAPCARHPSLGCRLCIVRHYHQLHAGASFAPLSLSLKDVEPIAVTYTMPSLTPPPRCRVVWSTRHQPLYGKECRTAPFRRPIVACGAEGALGPMGNPVLGPPAPPGPSSNACTAVRVIVHAVPHFKLSTGRHGSEPPGGRRVGCVLASRLRRHGKVGRDGVG